MTGGRIAQTTFQNVVLLSRNVEKTSLFYSEIVGLKLVHQTGTFAELRDFHQQGKFKLLIKEAPNIAYATFGYSPVLNFELGASANLGELVDRAKRDHNCELDGDIMEDEYLKIACIRTPDGQVLQLSQALKEHETERKYEEFIKKEGATMQEKEQTLDPKTQELRHLFQSIKL